MEHEGDGCHKEREGNLRTDKIQQRVAQGDVLCPRLFTMCLDPIAWKISATEGYKLSKPISFKVTDLLYIDDLKIFAASESKLNRVMNMVKTTMEDVGLAWNPKKCAVVHVRRGVHVSGNSGMILDELARIPSLQDGKQYKFLGVLESVMQEDKLVLECTAKEYLQRMSVIWTSPLSDHNHVTASNQFALPVLGYLMWTQQWPVMDIQEIDRKARKNVIENGGKHPCGSNAIFYLPRDKGGRGLRSVEMEYKAMKIKSAVRLYCNEDPAIQMVREFEERAEEMGRRSMVKAAFRFAEELGIELNLEHPRTVKTELRKCQIERLEEEVGNQQWQGSLVTTRLQDEKLSTSGCFWWLTEWKSCPTHTIAGMFELYEQLLPTRFYACQKTHTSLESEAWCRLCGKAPESVAHILSGCGALPQIKYLSRQGTFLRDVA